MGQDVFVDVAYRGLEVGRSLKLSEVGPRTAYLEHGTPMPVGAGLVLRNGDGLAIPVVVIRVHEQVAGAEMPPGMRIRTEDLEAAAAGWWRGLVSREDPEIPEAERSATTVMAAVEPPEPARELPAQELDARDTAVMNVDEVTRAAELAARVNGEGESGNGAAARAKPDEDLSPLTSSRTMVMSAVEIKAITDAEKVESEEGGETEPPPVAAADADKSGGNGAPGSNGDELRGQRARGRRRRRR